MTIESIVNSRPHWDGDGTIYEVVVDGSIVVAATVTGDGDLAVHNVPRRGTPDALRALADAIEEDHHWVGASGR